MDDISSKKNVTDEQTELDRICLETSSLQLFLYLPFQEFSPRLLTIETMYHEIRNVLYPESLQK